MNYWDQYYKKDLSPSSPTRFAVFCKKYLKKFNGKVFDIGCGNGRDVVFFNKKKINCYGVDLSKKAILQKKKNINQLKIIF